MNVSRSFPCPTALLAEDETVLRQDLRLTLQSLWPELQIVAEVSDGIAAHTQIQRYRPTIAFLDIHMPGMSGVDVAKLVAGCCHIVFITAYNDYAVQAFEHGAVDYVLKPLDLARLALTVQRLKEKVSDRPADLSMLRELEKPEPLRWIQASSGNQLRFVNVSDVLCFRADSKYTQLVTAKCEAYIRTTIKELAAQLDTEQFWQISRSAIVNVAAIDIVKKMDGGLALSLQHSPEWLIISQAYHYQFRQM
jgi:DNA-binding LytR/AlgR family response regulator